MNTETLMIWNKYFNETKWIPVFDPASADNA